MSHRPSLTSSLFFTFEFRACLTKQFLKTTARLNLLVLPYWFNIAVSLYVLGHRAKETVVPLVE